MFLSRQNSKIRVLEPYARRVARELLDGGVCSEARCVCRNFILIRRTRAKHYASAVG